MKIGQLALDDSRRRLAKSGVVICLGPICLRIRTPFETLANHLLTNYARATLGGDEDIINFNVEVVPAVRALGKLSRQARFLLDGQALVDDFPRHLVAPGFEWAVNWSLATRLHQFLLVHAAVVERNGHVIVLPGPPGSGKSTLCAGLVARRWRLFSDEFLVLDPATGQAVPLPRPVALKDGSISTVRRIASGETFGPEIPGTRKGVLTYMQPPAHSVEAAEHRAAPTHILFPYYAQGATAKLTRTSKARAFLRLADNSFNYGIRGDAGFDELQRLSDASVCYDLAFGDLADALDALELLVANTSNRADASFTHPHS